LETARRLAQVQVGSDVGELLKRSLWPTIGDGKILPLDVTAFAQDIAECAQHFLRRSRGRKKTNADLFVPLALLRARCERPRRRAAATGPSLVLMVASGELLFRC